MAHSSSDILSIQSNSEILLYHKICQVISYHLSLEADEVFDDQIEIDESYIWLSSQRKTRSRHSRKSCCIRFVKATRKSIYGGGIKYQNRDINGIENLSGQVK